MYVLNFSALYCGIFGGFLDLVTTYVENQSLQTNVPPLGLQYGTLYLFYTKHLVRTPLWRRRHLLFLLQGGQCSISTQERGTYNISYFYIFKKNSYSTQLNCPYGH